MSDGVRIYHPTARDVVLRIPHPGDATRAPKTYAIRLDGNGESIVTPTIWSRLEEARRAGWPHELILGNIVKAPPRQRIDLNRGQKAPRVRELHIARSH